MESPKRDVFVVVDEQILHIEKIGIFFGVRQNFDYSCNFLFMSAGRKSVSPDQRPKCIAKTGLNKPLAQTLVCKLVRFENLEYLFIFLPGNKFQLAKLH